MTVPHRPAIFVQAVMQRLGLERPSELARALGMTGYDAPRTVRRWLQDLNGPQYEYTMALLEKAGWLSADAEAYLQAAEAEASKAELGARRLADAEQRRAS